MSLNARLGSNGNAFASRRSAWRNSGFPAAPPSVVKRPGSRNATHATASTSPAIHAPIVRQGRLLETAASRSVIPGRLAPGVEPSGRTAELLVQGHERDPER